MTEFIETNLNPPPGSVRLGRWFNVGVVGKYYLLENDVLELDGFEYWYSAELFRWVKSPIQKKEKK